MNWKEHCDLCENQKTDLKDGMVCGITNQKPDFKNTCLRIELGNKFEREIGIIHAEIVSIMKKKTSMYVYFFVSVIIGTPLIISQSDFLTNFDFSFAGFNKLAGSLLIIFLGLGLNSIAFSKLNEYRKKIKTIKQRKSKIDAILDRYRVKYSCNVEFGKKHNDYQDVIVKLKSNSNLLKSSTITYQI